MNSALFSEEEKTDVYTDANDIRICFPMSPERNG